MPKARATHTIVITHPETTDIPDGGLEKILAAVGDQPLYSSRAKVILLEFFDKMVNAPECIKIFTTVEVED